MSRTYRRKSDYPPSWIVHEYIYCQGWSWYSYTKVGLTGKDLKREVAKWHSDSGWHGDYNEFPKWWNKLYHIRPARSEAKRLQKKVLQLVDYEDAPEFPLWPNGDEYYW